MLRCERCWRMIWIQGGETCHNGVEGQFDGLPQQNAMFLIMSFDGECCCSMSMTAADVIVPPSGTSVDRDTQEPS
jgi:hypothetical protein